MVQRENDMDDEPNETVPLWVVEGPSRHSYLVEAEIAQTLMGCHGWRCALMGVEYRVGSE